jgi:hypothetical protein
VDYTAGYATIPEDLQQACVMHVQNLYQVSQVNRSLSSARLGDAAETYVDPTKAATFSGDVSKIIDTYILHDRTISR